MIISITASLSSKMCNCSWHWQEFTLVTTRSTSDRLSTSRIFSSFELEFRDKFIDASWPDVSVFFEECNSSISHPTNNSKESVHPINQEQEMPSIRKPASDEIISDSVELWDTAVCFLHIQLIGTNVRLPKIHKILREVDLVFKVVSKVWVFE